MVRIGSKLQKQGVMALLSLVLINTGCEDRIEGSVSGLPKGTPVDVELSFGFADEVDGASLCPQTDTRATATDSNDDAFSVQLVPTRPTKAGLDEMNTSKPDKLYNLEIFQFDRSGRKIGGKALASEITIDAKLTVTLAVGDDCQLLIVARGKSGDIPTLSNCQTLADVYAIKKEALASNINNCTASADGIKNMPYFLFLEHVKVTGNGIIQSPDGSERYDVRLMLKRLAVQLRVDWTLGGELVTGNYKLKELKLCQVPADYRIFPQTEQTETWGKVYPVSTANFIDYYRLKSDATGTEESLTAAGGTKTVWMPANARGINSLVAGEKYRNNEYAESASTYLEFVVYNNEETERTYFRAYLGSNKTTDFNLLENTNYYWKIALNSINYSDKRIQILSQTPVKSTNLQPTANCFMMKPGTDICFNPYKHEAGASGWNTHLTNESGVIQNNKQITDVKVVWQTKDAGTAGELVLGYSVSKNSHVNLVSLDNGDNSETARVNIKAPVTKGGNAVVAAYNSSGTIVWSWHIWISDYIPTGLKDFTPGDATARQAAIQEAKTATISGTVHTYDGNEQYQATAWTESSGAFHELVIMDRNLGATRSTFSIDNALDAARTFGNLYEWGRKDPFVGSIDGSSVEINFLYDGDGVAIPIQKQQWSKGVNATSEAREESIKYPDVYYTSYNTSTAIQFPADSWLTATGAKTLYDPCPKGWRVPDFNSEEAKSMYKAFEPKKGGGALDFLIAGEWKNITPGSLTASQFMVTNGFLYYPKKEEVSSEERETDKAAWFPAIRLREFNTGKLREPFNSSGQFSSSAVPAFFDVGGRKL